MKKIYLPILLLTLVENLSKDFIKFANINGTDLNTAIDSVDSILL